MIYNDKSLMRYTPWAWWYTAQGADEIQWQNRWYFLFVVPVNKKTAPNMETENKYTIHSHIHQYAPKITVGHRRSLLCRYCIGFSQARLGSDVRVWFFVAKCVSCLFGELPPRPTKPRLSPSRAYSVSGSHRPRLSVPFSRGYCLRHSL